MHSLGEQEEKVSSFVIFLGEIVECSPIAVALVTDLIANSVGALTYGAP
jgi:hypothetical protein